MLIEKLPPSSQRKLPPHINETVSSSELKDCGHHTVPQWERHVLWTLSSSLSTNGARLELDRVLRTVFTSCNSKPYKFLSFSRKLHNPCSKVPNRSHLELDPLFAAHSSHEAGWHNLTGVLTSWFDPILCPQRLLQLSTLVLILNSYQPK